MCAFMTPAEIAARTSELTSEFEKLLANRRIVMRPRSKQWAFLRHCFSVTLANTSSEFACTKSQALQYRFEVEDKLQRYYLSARRPVHFIFRLLHIDRALAMRFVDETYPNANGYVLVVTEECDAAAGVDRNPKDLLERVVTEAADAEWAVYKKLPLVDLLPLEQCYVVGGPAHRRIQHLAERHCQRQWTITQPENNPSTKRVLDVKVIKIDNAQALVRTKEYWYLRWWSLEKGDYAKVDYRETNMQTYVLQRRENQWLIQDNIYPPPRNQAPHRKGIIVG